MNKEKALILLKEVYKRCNSVFPYGLQDVFLYGSYARGDYDSDSDIDFLVTVDLSYSEIEKFRRKIAKISSELSLEYDILVSLHVHPLQQFKEYSTVLPFYKNILKEGIRYAS